MDKIILIGAGGHARSCIDVIEATGNFEIGGLIEKDKDCCVSISHTTRKIRQGEKDKEHYYFVSDLEFDKLVEEGAFLEWAHVFKHKYGTAKFAVDKLLDAGKNVFLDIDWQGARQIKNIYTSTIIR